MNIKQKPQWIKVKALSEDIFDKIKSISLKYNLYTVCNEAKCPNINECYSANNATFLLMGKICTRNCSFCNVKTGNPKGYLDKSEPLNVAKALRELNLKYIVLTSVDRDDILEEGSTHFAQTIEKIRKLNRETIIEALIPDFLGNKDSLNTIINSKPDVISHNIETVERLSPVVRDKRASYRRSLNILQYIKEVSPKIITKSSILVGFSETGKEVERSLKDLKRHNVDIIVIGQYLRPTARQLEVKEYVKPSQFKEYENFAKSLGFPYVISSPLARTSYKAAEAFRHAKLLRIKYHL